MNEHARNFASSQAPLRIRQARASDAAALCAAERDTARIPGRLVSRPDELMPAAFTRKIAELANLADRADAGCYLVAERADAIVAHGLLEPALPLAALAHVRTLSIVVHPAYAGQGIGSALMQALLDWAQATAAVEKIELRVRAGNEAAVHLYKKFGFVEEGRFRRRLKLADGAYLDDITMAWFKPDPRGRDT